MVSLLKRVHTRKPAFLILDQTSEKLAEPCDKSDSDFLKPPKTPSLVLYKSWVWNHGRLKYGIHGKKCLDKTSWDCNHCRARNKVKSLSMASSTQNKDHLCSDHNIVKPPYEAAVMATVLGDEERVVDVA